MHDRTDGAEPTQQGQHRLEEPESRRGPVLGADGLLGATGQQLGQLRGPGDLLTHEGRATSQRLGQRGVRQWLPDHRDAGAREDLCLDAPEELPGQSRLADPELAAHQHRGGVALGDPGQGGMQDAEVVPATHHPSTRGVGHLAMMLPSGPKVTRD